MTQSKDRPTLTITYYMQLADEFMKALDAIMPVIPKPKPSHVHTLDYFRSYLNVPDPFLGTAVWVVKETPALQAVGKLNIPEGYDTLQFMEAFRPVFAKLAAFEKLLKFTYDSRKASLALQALEIYDVAKALSKRPGNEHLAKLVAMMKRDLGKRGRPKLSRAARKTETEAEVDVNPS